ncbi:hypothetical protein C0033_20035 [Clostridium sp. chh4-2]|uniref:hypothetical protein n=1 Tax=Clostridium sp. chh4-2 TaxID=2067550 RepID=UPI000CCF1ECE|nr:hypothetical protein [Clostridium sp. chh4-2]PNV60332.1 hypothetical protein C0033_20035 [Clostridium sp. chh4-2]
MTGSRAGQRAGTVQERGETICSDSEDVRETGVGFRDGKRDIIPFSKINAEEKFFRISSVALIAP